MLTITTVLGNTITADSIAELRLRFSEHRDDNFYGASDIGARFNVMKGDECIGVLSYNGKYTEGESVSVTGPKHRTAIAVVDHELGGKIYSDTTRVGILTPTQPDAEHTSWGSDGLTIPNRDLPRLIEMLSKHAQARGLLGDQRERTNRRLSDMLDLLNISYTEETLHLIIEAVLGQEST